MVIVFISHLETTYWLLSIRESVVLTTFRNINNTRLPIKRKSVS